MSEAEKSVLDQEQLKGQEKLTEEQEQAILDQVLADREKKENEPSKEKSSWDLHLERQKKEEEERKSEDETDDEDAESGDDESDSGDDDGKTKEDEEGDKETDDSQKEDGKSEDDETDDGEKEKTQAEKEKQSTKEDIETEIAEYAEANGLDDVDAREIVEGVHGIVKKYGSDNKKIAFAYRNLQSHTSKVDEENRAIKQEVEYLNQKMSETSLFPKTVLFEGKEYSVDQFQEMAIDAYRKEYQDKTEDLEDSEVWKMAYQDIDKNMETLRAERQRETTKQASKKRVEHISTLTASHQRFLPDVKPMLDKMSDIQILNPKFTLDDLILLAKGKHYDVDMKKAKEQEYKKGTEQAKILGEKKSVSKGSSIKTKTKRLTLSDDELTRARNMFGGAGLTDEQIIEYYNDHEKKRKEIDNKHK